MEAFDGGERLAAFLRSRNCLSPLEGFVARADCFGEPVLIEFGRLRFPPAGRDFFGGDGDRLETRFREGECRGGRAQGLETDLLQGVGEEPALESDAVLSGAFAGLEFVQGGFRAVGKGFVVGSRAAMSSGRSVSPSRRSVRNSGSSAAKARSWSRSICLASSSWLSAQRGRGS